MVNILQQGFIKRRLTISALHRIVPTFATVVGLGQVCQGLSVLVPAEDWKTRQEAGTPQIVAEMNTQHYNTQQNQASEM